MNIQEDPFSDDSPFPQPQGEPSRDLPLFSIPVRPLIAFIEAKTGAPFPVGKSLPQPGQGVLPPGDWHRLLRGGLGKILHINLGIPGIEAPPHPIEENAAALEVALHLGRESLEVILSGELELAVEAGLIPERALSDLRNKIRVSG
ncbi:MAG: hypothetical protein R6V45_03310 [Oceanipulchritudo sp.]